MELKAKKGVKIKRYEEDDNATSSDEEYKDYR